MSYVELINLFDASYCVLRVKNAYVEPLLMTLVIAATFILFRPLVKFLAGYQRVFVVAHHLASLGSGEEEEEKEGDHDDDDDDDDERDHDQT